MLIGDWRNPADAADPSAFTQVGPVFPNLLKVLGLLVAGMAVAGGAAFAQTGGPTPSAPGSAVYFVDLKDGDALPPKLTIHFGLRNMGVAPAGLRPRERRPSPPLIDAPTPALDKPIPNDFNHLHFGAGPDRSRDHPHARQAHPAASARRQGSHPAQSAGDVARGSRCAWSTAAQGRGGSMRGNRRRPMPASTS